MTTSASRNSTSRKRSAASTLTKRSVVLPLNLASPNTGMRLPRQNASAASCKTSSTSKATISRIRHVIVQEDTGMFLGTLENGKPVWVKSPLQAMTHCHHDTVLRNLYALREFYDIPENLGTREVTFYAYASNPLTWFTDHD